VVVEDPAAEETSKEPQLNFRLTPYTAVPRRLPWFGGSRGQERIGTALLFVFLPSVLYWTWLGTDGLHGIPEAYASMRWAAPLSGLFITVGPLLMQQGEFIYEDLLASLAKIGADAQWGQRFVQAQINRLDAIYYPFVIVLGTAMGAAIGYVFFSIGKIAPLTSPAERAGLVIVLMFVGPTAATGVWGAIKMLLVVATVTRTAELEWSPFSSSAAEVSRILSFAWRTGLLFSMSNITVPALIVAAPLLPAPARLITWAFIILTFAGGLLLFLLTSSWLFGMVKRQQQNYLDRFAPCLERLAIKVQAMDSLAPDDAANVQLSLNTTLTLIQRIEVSNPTPPLFKTLTRAASTLLVPVLITVAQLLTARVI
jgi:hypothetical protein